MTALISSPLSLRGYPSEKRPSAAIVDSPASIETLGDGDVTVLDDQIRGRAAPLHVPGAHALADEVAFDARLRESLEEGAVEFSSTADLNPAGWSAECRHDARQHRSLSCQSMLVT